MSFIQTPAVVVAAALLGGLGAAPAQATAVSGQGTWETTLKARDIDGNAVALDSANAAFFYDSVMNITWLADFNYAKTSQFDSDGKMYWSVASQWAANLQVGEFDDWRLPKVIDSGTAGCNFSNAGGTDCGYNVQTQVGTAYSEWAYLFYVTLGNLAACKPGYATCTAQAGSGLSNTAYFDNMLGAEYWSSTPDPTNGRNFIMGLSHGGQVSGFVSNLRYAAVVRNGDVLNTSNTVTSSVPEPSSLALALLGLAGVAGQRRRSLWGQLLKG